MLWLFLLTVLLPWVCPAATQFGQSSSRQSSLVYPGRDGRLVYKPYTKEGDTIIDFSYCGYKRSEEPIPDVPVAVTLSPLPGKAEPDGAMAYPKGPDSYPQIQKALDQVAAKEPDATGFRGAVLLKKGTYYVNGGLVLDSGVVLRGEGDGEDGTVLIFRNPQGTGISAGKEVIINPTGDASRIKDKYVPAGSMSFQVDSAREVNPGDLIVITKTVNDDWIKVLGMDDIGQRTDGRKVKPWTVKSYQLKHVRQVTEVKGNKITLDVPLPQSFDEKFGGGSVQEVDLGGSSVLCGVENLRVVSNYDLSIKSMIRAKRGEYEADEENNLNTGISLKCINGWVRNCTIMHTSRQSVQMKSSRFTTVRDCKSMHPVSVISGARRYSFSNNDGAMSLVYNCYAEDGRHDYVTGSRESGPIAFVKSSALRANAPSETHHRWAAGVLFDNIEIKEGGGIAAANRGTAGSGQGWAGANVVIWNCKAPFIKVEDPPTPEQNFAIGCTATEKKGRYAGMQGDGFMESTDRAVKPDSLFVQQLIDRIGEEKAMQVLKAAN